MPLTLRRTDLPRSADDGPDWCVYEDGKVIGRIYEVRRSVSPACRWFWAHHLMDETTARGHLRCDGQASTFEEAKAQFAAAVKAFRAWPAKRSDSHSGAR